MTMKKNRKYRYSEISSFEDFIYEKERLNLRRNLVETKISYGFLFLRKSLSISSLISSLLKHKF
jgi:hypothetical protein